jgi:hypothetical protein
LRETIRFLFYPFKKIKIISFEKFLKESCHLADQTNSSSLSLTLSLFLIRKRTVSKIVACLLELVQ